MFKEKDKNQTFIEVLFILLQEIIAKQIFIYVAVKNRFELNIVQA